MAARWRLARRLVLYPAGVFFPVGAYEAYKYRPRNSADVDYHEKLVRRMGGGGADGGVRSPVQRVDASLASSRRHPRTFTFTHAQRGTERSPTNVVERALFDAARTFTIVFVCECAKDVRYTRRWCLSIALHSVSLMPVAALSTVDRTCAIPTAPPTKCSVRV